MSAPPGDAVLALLDIMARLRGRDGCPWDREQTFATIVPFTIEEAYEVADAIGHNDLAALRDELGDLLFQVVFHARIAEEQGAFSFADVAMSIATKLVRRHPHVFANAPAGSLAGQREAWEAHKAAERAAGPDGSALAGVAQALPALLRAAKLGARAARVGFDWESVAGVRAKLAEELAELAAAEAKGDAAAVADELGDVLFTVANLARRLNVPAEDALRAANDKFERRFRAVEALLADAGRNVADASPAELDAAWQEVKQRQGGNGPVA